MVVGEPQILGQVKRAFLAAQEAGTVGGALTALAQAAFGVAKRVRTETAIGSAPVSIASAAVDLAYELLGSLEGRIIALVGAGKTSELTAKHLASSRLRVTDCVGATGRSPSLVGSRLRVTNRTFARAEELARKVDGQAVPWEELPRLLAEADIVVSSTAAPQPVLTKVMVQEAVRARQKRPLLLVDLAVPRDVEEGVAALENVFAHDVDDLERVVRGGRASREAEAKTAELIIMEEVRRFLKGRQIREQIPVLAMLRSRADEIARLEAERTLAVFDGELSSKQRGSIEAMGKAIVNKLLHGATARLRDASERDPDEAAALATMVAQLFNLDTPKSKST